MFALKEANAIVFKTFFVCVFKQIFWPFDISNKDNTRRHSTTIPLKVLLWCNNEWQKQQ